MKLCYSCFNKIEDEYRICPHCGQEVTEKPLEPIHLTCGTILANRYIIGIAVGSGGFGIVYKAYDMKLGVVVAIKEFYVSRLVTRAEGLKNVIINKKSAHEFDYRKKRFLAEARNMAKFSSHRSIPNVFEFFEENNTAYIVMELLKGMTLNEYLRQNGGIVDVDLAIMIANEVGNALKSLHENKIIHRDVAPDNIFICTGKEIRIKLMDLGAAKLEDSSDDAIDIILKPGYAPPEQYDTTKNIGPWTDVYALGASMYVMLTGVKPDESTNRKIMDELAPVYTLNSEVPINLNNIIHKAMAIEKHMRFKNVDEFLKALNGNKKVVSLKKEKKRRKRNRFISIIAAVMAIVIGVSTIVIDYNRKQQLAGYLEDAEITVWYIQDDDNKTNNLEIISKKFIQTYKEQDVDIKINLVEYPREIYIDKLNEARAEGNLPNLFESTNIEDDIMDDAIQLDKVVDSQTFKKTDILSENYDSYYKGEKTKMPMAIDVPLAVVVTNGQTSVDYESRFYSSFYDFDTSYITYDTASFVFEQGVNSGTDITVAKSLENYAVVFSSSERISKIKEAYRQVNCTYKAVYPKTQKIVCEFAYELSIFDSTDNEDAAALMFLERMLSEDYQCNICNDRVPVNPQALPQDRPNDNFNLYLIKDLYSKFVF